MSLEEKYLINQTRIAKERVKQLRTEVERLQAPCVPLTDEQILSCGPGQEDAVWNYESQLYFARAVLALAAGQKGGLK